MHSRRFYSAALACMTALALCACGSSASSSQSSSPSAPASAVTEAVSEAVSETTPEEASAPEEATSEAAKEEVVSETGSETGTEADASADISAEADIAYEFGVSTATTYESKTLGIGCELSEEEWYIATPEELIEIMGATAELLSNNNMENLVEEGGTVTDFYAANYYGDTMNIGIQSNESLFSTVTSALLSDEDYRDLVYDQMIAESLDQYIYQTLGISDGAMTKDTVTFLGKKYPCIKISGTISYEGEDYPLYETLVHIRKGKYVGTLTAASFEIDDTESYLSSFYLLD